MKKSICFRELQERREAELLSPRAALAKKSRGRLSPEPECLLRTAFQRDRDRILYSKAFRRLMHKTQVFIAPEGDHYRTRLTHTLEVAQLARTISLALGLNVDLTEAIALGHDLGHAPFGHAGETELNRLLAEFSPKERFRHQEQSLRVVDLLEKPGGLNLTWETRDGIYHHAKGRSSLSSLALSEEEEEVELPATLEGEVVRISDRLAYINHDIDDALRAGIIKEKALPAAALKVLGSSTSKRINTMITDLIQTSQGSQRIKLSRETTNACEELKEFLWTKVYLDSEAKKEEEKCEKMLAILFNHFMQTPRQVPAFFFSNGLDRQKLPQRARAVCDYIAGMTDHYALLLFEKLFVPQVWQHF